MIKKKKPRRLSNAINAGSMADIAFLLLIFFLVTATILEDHGIKVKLPPWQDLEKPINVNTNNVLSVKINALDELLVEGEQLPIDALKAKVKEFIMNPMKRQDLPSKPKKAVISIQNDEGTHYATYLMVYNELQAAYNELWEVSAQNLFQESYKKLNEAQQKAIRIEIPLVISEAEPTDYAQTN